MDKKFQEYKGLDLSQVNKDVLKEWKAQHTFEESLKIREGHPSFVFFEGPPSANGMPGIHHVMARTIKDIICRYKTLQGFLVERKAGWDTHGLPVELGVEKKLGITKENIGKTISVADYNKECRADVMKFTREWEDLTDKMGYWVNMEDPYITYDNRYIETLWYLLKQLYEKGFLYKGYTIQPYSPAAGTGLSTHELNQPGCYRDVKDTTCVAQFKVIRDEKSEKLFAHGNEVYFTAWTTTPWTLPSNTALAVGPTITYLEVKTYNPYTFRPVTVIMAKDRFSAYFNKKAEDIALGDYKEGDKLIPYEVVAEYKGTDLEGMRYEQLLPWMKPMGDAFRVILGDYVSTEDGTGIVHIAPTFGADDDRVAKVAGIAPLMLIDKEGNKQPMVDKQGRLFLPSEIDADFLKNNVDIELYAEFAGRFVKNAYDPELSDDDPTLDIDLSILLKRENKAFKVEKHEHNYPHCWRTDKPVLYYPLDSWFIKTTAVRDRMIELNKTINWKPASTGEGRFGKWLENLVDWNLSRSRYWGTPLPIWVSEDGTEKKCIGSVKELAEEIEKAIQAGVMKESPFKDFKIGDYSKENYDKIDLHRPYVDDIILVSATGQPMYREKDLIDVWFDSGAMPYAQVHYPFENKELIDNHIKFPADFIAEGVDQTRGWFFTLHAIATMVFDSVAFKNIISNGLVLDAKGNKMSKRLGNAVDPFDTIEKQGSDPLRWYMITNSQPWDNLKFDIAGVEEVKRKFFGTLYNTYSFFALYANIDNFTYAEAEVPFNERPEIDRWILSLLNSLIKEVTEAYESYEPTRAGRAIQNFVIENLSNWYVRLSRKRYWGGEQTADKLSAYQTLYTCLETVSILSSPIAPFYMDRLFRDLNNVTGRYTTSVHLVDFPVANDTMIDKQLEERMDMAQQISSMVLGLRRKVQIRVRQPLCKLLIPILNEEMTAQLDAVKSIILSEVNVKEIEYITDTAGILIKKIKPNFKTLGPKYGKYMKQISALVAEMDQSDIYNFEKQGTYSLQVGTENLELTLNDVEILSEDIPGWLVANEGRLTVALDINITKELREEGIARELINRIQNLRKESNFNVTDKIDLQIGKHKDINDAVENFKEYIASQVLAENVTLVDKADEDVQLIEIDDIHTFIKIQRM
ncbi:isoleucine--tRNA ligase [Butyricimonas synergistica]|uniref:isoleucine--tRNA ligase n=1 Tax=Butyricimonas synergistica TaxID=544644 RepID=UPI00035F4353|nr:isoleucine--tRNA ligase [Butyricimonas synergistica]